MIGTKISLRTLKGNVKASMVPWPQSKWRRRHKWALMFVFSTYRWPYVGRDLCQIRCYRKCQKGHPRTQWPLVWWTTSICSLYLWRYHASSSIGCSKQDLRRYSTKNHFFDTDPPNWLLFSLCYSLSQITVICRSSVFSLGPSSWLSQGGRQVPRW